MTSKERIQPEDGNAPAQVVSDLAQLDDLSLYGKKRLLINREIDSQGMGKYQWCIWLLCGLDYFLDIAWAHAFALVLSPLKQELGFSNGHSGNIATSLNAGLTAGAFFWGVMSDVIGMPSLLVVCADISGRRWAFNMTCLLSAVFGLCLGAVNSYSTFLVLTAFVGFGIGGNIPIDTAIVLECISQLHCAFLCSIDANMYRIDAFCWLCYLCFNLLA